MLDLATSAACAELGFETLTVYLPVTRCLKHDLQKCHAGCLFKIQAAAW